MVPIVVLGADEEARRLEDYFGLGRVLDVKDVRLLGSVRMRGLENKAMSHLESEDLLSWRVPLGLPIG